MELTTIKPILVGMRLRLLTSIVIAMIALSACSSSSTKKSLGDCAEVGTFKKVDGVLFVCSGQNGNRTYYAEGPNFNDMVFAGRVLAYEVIKFDGFRKWGPIESRLQTSNVQYAKSMTKITGLDIVDQISIYSAGSARWDGLITALTGYQSTSLVADQAMAKVVDLLKQISKSNDGRENTLSEKKSAMDYLLPSSEKEEIALATLRPEIIKLRSHLIGKFGIRATSELIEFAISYYAQPNV